MQCIIMENTLIKLTLHDETKKRAHDSQIVRAKENLKLSHGGYKNLTMFAQRVTHTLWLKLLYIRTMSSLVTKEYHLEVVKCITLEFQGHIASSVLSGSKLL